MSEREVEVDADHSERDIALILEDYRQELIALLDPLVARMETKRRKGFIAHFAIGQDPIDGSIRILGVHTAKVLPPPQPAGESAEAAREAPASKSNLPGEQGRGRDG